MNYFLAADETPKESNPWMMVGIFVVLAIVVVVMFVLPMINQRKQQKNYKNLVEGLKVGDTIKTIGGVVGIVKRIITLGAEKQIVVETGLAGSETTMIFDINAFYQVIDPNTGAPIPPVQPTAAKPEEKKAEKEDVKADDVIEAKAEDQSEADASDDVKPEGK